MLNFEQDTQTKRAKHARVTFISLLNRSKGYYFVDKQQSRVGKSVYIHLRLCAFCHMFSIPEIKKNEKEEQIGHVATIAESMFTVPAGIKPPLVGSRMRMWKQDPSVKEIGVRTVYVHTSVFPGPSDSQIAIRGLPPILPDANGDFLFDPPDTTVIYDIYAENPRPTLEDQVFDGVHTYAVVRKVVTMYQQLLRKRLFWQWNSETNREPIKVYPHAGFAKSAYYDRTDQALKFFYVFFYDKPPVFNCRSLDLVAHETGHAILDAFQPGWLPPEQVFIETAALHESFGDLTAIFLILSQMDLVEYIIAETKADLHYQKNILAVWSEQLGEIIPIGGTRSAANELKMSDADFSYHDLSRVFTGAVYDTLSDIFTYSRNPRIRDDAETLYAAGKYMAWLTVNAFIESPPVNPTFRDTATKMIEIAELEGRLDIAHLIKKNFIHREILGKRAPKLDRFVPLDRLLCFATDDSHRGETPHP